MSRRIEIELTSSRDDGSFTWRAAGARQPKGVVTGSIMPEGAAVGDTFKVEAETGLEGTDILSVVSGRAPRSGPERLELISKPVADDALVTSKLAGKGRGDRGDRGGRRPEGRDGDRGRRGDGPNKGRGAPSTRGRSGERPERGPRGDGAEPRGERRGPRPERAPAAPPKPKVPRLRPGRVHRNAALESLPPEQRPIAEQVLKGGVPAVRQGIERQNEQARAKGEPEVTAQGLIELAEKMLPMLHAAEWRDRADAAIADIDLVDLRDLRSVVVASEDNAKDDETRALAVELRTKLAERVDRAQHEWLTELDEALTEKRIVRALKLSSRPPKAGSPLPAELVDRITAATNASLTSDAGATRWIAIIDALAFSPVRHKVMPEKLPDTPSAELLELLGRVATRLPELAKRFGVEPTAAPSRAAARPNRRRKPSNTGGGSGSEPKRKTGAQAPAPKKTGDSTTPPAPTPDEAANTAPTEQVAADASDAPADAAKVDSAPESTQQVDNPTSDPQTAPDADATAPHATPAESHDDSTPPSPTTDAPTGDDNTPK